MSEMPSPPPSGPPGSTPGHGPEPPVEIAPVEQAAAPIIAPEMVVTAVAEAASAAPAVWYTGRAGRQEGPFATAELRRQVRCGELREADLVWRQGMRNWVAVREVPDLVAPPAAAGQATAPVAVPPLGTTRAAAPPQATGGPIPAAGPPTPPAAPRPSFQPAEIIRNFNAVFSCPMFYRTAGYVAAGLGLFTLLISLPLWLFNRSWFTGVLLFALIFFVCHGAAAILERLQQADGQAATKDDPTRHL